jgi:hypothetical protein
LVNLICFFTVVALGITATEVTYFFLPTLPIILTFPTCEAVRFPFFVTCAMREEELEYESFFFCFFFKPVILKLYLLPCEMRRAFTYLTLPSRNLIEVPKQDNAIENAKL